MIEEKNELHIFDGDGGWVKINHPNGFYSIVTLTEFYETTLYEKQKNNVEQKDNEHQL